MSKIYQSSKALKALQFFLLLLIIVGIILLFTQKTWVPKVVEYILTQEVSGTVKTPQDNFLSTQEEFDPMTQNEKRDLIRIATPVAGSTVTNPISVSGEARGYWFFEASFPIVIVDWDGRIIGEGYASATEDWMTEQFVPFAGTISYSLPEDVPYKRGAIIFRKDNPSGLPEHDDALEIPIIFE